MTTLVALTRIQTLLEAATLAHVSFPWEGDGTPQDSWWMVTNPAAQQHRCPDPDGSQNTGHCVDRTTRDILSEIQMEWKHLQENGGKKSLHTPEDEVMRQIPLVLESLQWEASSAGWDTKRQTYRVECLTAAPWPQWLGLRTDDTHHAEMESFAEVHLLQQMQQPLPHLLWFEKQTMDGLERTTFTQEVQNCQEKQVLLGQMVLWQLTFGTCRKKRWWSVTILAS